MRYRVRRESERKVKKSDGEDQKCKHWVCILIFFLKEERNIYTKFMNNTYKVL